MQIAPSVLDLVGNTPMVFLNRVRSRRGARVAAKLEMFNPGASVKDRIGLPLIRAGEKAGLLKPGGTIVEPTSGNTGLGLAMAATVLGYRMVCTVPDKVTREKMDLLRSYGAELIVCPTNVEADDPRSYYKQAERLRDEEGAYLPYQYHNQANPQAHMRTTGPEVWRQTEGKLTHFVAGMGTGGTISGIGRYLHRMASRQGRPLAVVGVDTVGSIYTHYHKTGAFPKDIHQYLVDGIGEDFMPATVWWDEVDHVVQVTDEDAYLMQARLAREEALFTGSSGGAAVHAAVQLAARLPRSALVVTLLPDTGERYLSKFNVEWMERNGLTKAPAYLKRAQGARPRAATGGGVRQPSRAGDRKSGKWGCKPGKGGSKSAKSGQRAPGTAAKGGGRTKPRRTTTGRGRGKGKPL